MANTSETPRRRGPIQIGELVGKVIDPVTAKRGFATTDLVAAWPEIVGQRFAECTRPEKIAWPRGEAREGEPALLILRVEGPRAIYVQHEAGQIVERVNAFLGYGAIGNIRIVQGPVGIGRKDAAPRPAGPLAADREAQLAGTIAGVAGDTLRAALDRLGRGVLSEPPPAPGRGRQPP